MQNKPISSVFIFFTLVFLLSIPFWLLGVVHPIELLPSLPISAFGAFTPVCAALVLTYQSEHRTGIIQLLQRSFDFKRVKNGNWFLIVLLINPTIAVLAYAIMRMVGVFLPNLTPWTLAIIPIFVFFFIGALGEEIGWSGYATEPLQVRWGTMMAGVFIGLVWAVWHFIPLAQAHRSIEWIIWWSLNTVALRMIMTWLYMNSGKSVFAVTLFHAMTNLAWQLFPIHGSYYDPRIFGLVTLSFALALYAGQRLLSRGKVSFA